MITIIIKTLLRIAIYLHDAMHTLSQVKGMGMAKLEAKLE